jgi:hypothetical protein
MLQKTLFLLYLVVFLAPPLSWGYNNGAILGEQIAIHGEQNLAFSDSEIQTICLSGGRPRFDCKGPLTSNLTLAESICLSNGRPKYDCKGPFTQLTLAEGICLSGGRPKSDCTGPFTQLTLAEGICLSSGRPKSDCTGPFTQLTLAEGICLRKIAARYECNNVTMSSAIDLPVEDHVWAWDEYEDPNSFEKTWVCRGRQTGEFAEHSKCNSAVQDDNTWPNY